MFDPGFSETEEVRVMRVNEIRYCCRVDRVKNGTGVKSAYREVDKARIQFNVTTEKEQGEEAWIAITEGVQMSEH